MGCKIQLAVYGLKHVLSPKLEFEFNIIIINKLNNNKLACYCCDRFRRSIQTEFSIQFNSIQLSKSNTSNYNVTTLNFQNYHEWKISGNIPILLYI